MSHKGEIIQTTLEQRLPSFAEVCPRHIDPAALVKGATMACYRDPKLLACTPKSIAMAVMAAAELGLVFSSSLGQAYLVPYGDTCSMILGYRGMIDLARRSGVLQSIESHAVYEGDQFELTFGLEPKLVHVPNVSQVPDDDHVIGVYCIARLKGGGHHIEWMSKAETDMIRAGAKSGNFGPWAKHPTEMRKKSVIRRAFKYLPVSQELQRAFEVDDRDYSNVVVNEGFEALDPAAAPREGRQSFGFGASGDVERAVSPELPDSPAAAGGKLQARLAALASLVSAQTSVENEGTCELMARAWLRNKWKLDRLEDDDTWRTVLEKADKVDWDQFVPVEQ